MASQLEYSQHQDGSRLQKPDKKSGGFACEIVDPPPEHLLQTECPVCLLTIREPHQVTCCGYSFCHSCIQRIKDKNKPCPTCKKEGFSDFPDMRLKRALYTLKVHCSHQKDGCEWTGELGQLDVHLYEDPEPEKQLNGCQFVEIDCLYECGDRLQRRYMHKHQTELCTKRPFSCEHCHNYESNYADVIHNHWPVCGSFPLRCPNQCGSFPQRQNIKNHIDNECPLTTIDCDFHHVGCTVKLPRKDMPEHLRENLITHISLLATSHAKQQAKLFEYQVQLVKQKDEQQSQIAQLRTRNEKLEAEVTALKMRIKTESSKAGLHVEAPGMKEQSKQLEHTLKTELSTHVIPHTTIPLGPPVLIMTNFQQHKRDRDWWFSPPVYTGHQGYKICLGVYANGHGLGKGTHLSVFICFMKGEFDDSLKWPFRGVIAFRLLDQVQGNNHVVYGVTYNDSTSDRHSARVTSEERSHGLGKNEFIAHSELEPKYLQKGIQEVELK